MKIFGNSSIRVFALQAAAICLVLVLAVTTVYIGIQVFRPDDHTASTFDETLLSDEPLQMSDIRLSLTRALAISEKDQWSVVLRLIRDGRNQWESFLPSMKDVYKSYAWTTGDINRATQLWEDMIDQTELRNPTQLRSSILSLIGIMDKYRQHRAG